MALADEGSPVFVARGMNTFASMFHDMSRVAEAFRGDGAMSWGDHHPCLFRGTEWFFRTGYRAHLTTAWIPGARRRRRPAQGGRARRRRRVRAWRVGGDDGLGVSRLGLHRVRLPRAVDRDVPRAGPRGGRERARRLPGRHCDRVRRGIRPDLLLRLPARHGRPGRRRPARTRTCDPAARSCSSSRSPSTRGRGTSPRTRWRPCSTWPRRASARPTRSRRRSAPPSAPRPARRSCAHLRGGRLRPLPARGPDADEPDHRGQGVSRSAPSAGSGDRSMRRRGPFVRRLPGPPDAGFP